MKPKTSKDGIHGQRIEHPAFGAITVSRVSASHASRVNLHASNFKHGNFVILSINFASISRADSYDHHHPEGKIIEIMMSEAQWATFVSSFNLGSGVPCTLSWMKGVGKIPNIESESQVDFLKQKALDRLDQLLSPVESMQAVLNEQKMTAKAKRALQEQIDKLKMEIQYNLPYFRDNFERHMENVTEKAKVEVHAYINNRISQAGLKSLSVDGEVLSIESDSA